MQFRTWKVSLAAAAAALLLSSCGGSGPSLTGIVSFGDSLSDVGTYRVGTVAAVGGGQFTVNEPAPTNWTEFLARSLGQPAPCAAQTGLRPNLPGIVGATVTDHPGCTNYAQGSARVSQPLGPDAVGLQAAPFNQTNLGLMAVPMATQVASHLAANGGSFSGLEVITVWGGGNDVFMNLAAVAAASGGGAAAVGAAMAAGWPASAQAAVAAGGAAASQAAVNAALAAMGQAGAELATLVRDQLLAKGARRVIVVNLPAVSLTPRGLGLSADQRNLLVAMENAFNSQLLPLASLTGVLHIDVYALQQTWSAEPMLNGFNDVTTPSCNPVSPLNPFQGASLTCTVASTYPVSTFYAFADTVHPTPYAHRKIAEFVLPKLRALNWF